MAIKFKNSFTNVKEDFIPIEEGKVKIYTCGPTVHDFAHIGNFRTFIWGDLLRRYLLYKGYDVTYVINITDIDDRIIQKTQKAGVTRKEFIDDYVKAFLDDFDSLGLKQPDILPYATDHIDGMVKMIQKLVEKGLAYEIEGSYYYKISEFKDYGKLANLDFGGLKAGARVATDRYEKDSASDFALWKAWEESDGDIYWDTALGKGRPGWHIECSVMSQKYLGDIFDIHTGGVDLMFPHHENEIAQSQGATGKNPVKYWLHGEHLIIEKETMSKSLGNSFTLHDILDKGYSGVVVRYLLLSIHYRQQLNFTFAGLDSARNALERYTDFKSNLADYAGAESDGSAGEIIDKAKQGFEVHLDDDLNISGALGVVFDFIRDINRLKAENKLSIEERDSALELFDKIDAVLNLSFHLGEDDESVDEIEKLIEQRTEAKKNKDFATADKIRSDLAERGIILEDSSQGTKWKRKLN
jgi:cysteinyl-tRNA synthetase